MGNEHWVETSIDNVVLSKKGKKPGKLEPLEFKNSLPYIDIEAFETGKIKQYADVESSNHCQPDDILVVWDGARFGLTGTNQKGAIGSTLACLTPILIESSFLHKFIHRHYGTIQQKPKGMATPHVDPDVFWNLEFPLPPLPEQKRIVKKLDAILPKVKNAKSRLYKIPRILKRFRQSVLASACSGKLTEGWREENPEIENAGEMFKQIQQIKNKALLEKKISKDKKCDINILEKALQFEIPEMWKWVRIQDIYEVLRGGSPRPAGDSKYFGGSFPWITVKELTKDDNTYLCQTEFFLTEIGRKHSREVYPDELLLTNSGATLGVPKISKIKGCFNDAVALLRIFHKFVKNEYAYYYLSHETESFRQVNQGMAQPNLNTCIISAWLFPLPPFEEQEEIVRRVEKLFKLAHSLEAKYKKALARVEKIEQSVLAKTFRGELAPQDPNDEPAEELLKRILAEKAKLETVKKKSKRFSPRRNRHY